MKKLDIQKLEDSLQVILPESSATGFAAAQVNAAQVVPTPPRSLEVSTAAIPVRPVQQPSPSPEPLAPLVLQIGTKTPEPPLTVDSPPLAAPFVEPWLHPTLNVGVQPAAQIAPLSAPFVEPWLTGTEKAGQGDQTAGTPEKQKQEDVTPPKTKKRKAQAQAKNSTKNVFITAARDLLIALALLFIVLQFFAPSVVKEHSMENTLRPNDILYVTKQAYWFGLPGYDDIIIFQSGLHEENGAEKTLVKRIVGLPGDRISIQGGTVFRNGEPLDEPYTKDKTTEGTLSEVVVPADSYFVLGDNREVSRDSRDPSVGFVAKEQLRGQVLVRVFPLNDFKFF